MYDSGEQRFLHVGQFKNPQSCSNASQMIIVELIYLHLTFKQQEL
jgi:hypothetical protein